MSKRPRWEKVEARVGYHLPANDAVNKHSNVAKKEKIRDIQGRAETRLIKCEAWTDQREESN